MSAEDQRDAQSTLDEVLQETDAALALVDATGINLSCALLRILEKAPGDDRPLVLEHIAMTREEVASRDTTRRGHQRRRRGTPAGKLRNHRRRDARVAAEGKSRGTGLLPGSL